MVMSHPFASLGKQIVSSQNSTESGVAPAPQGGGGGGGGEGARDRTGATSTSAMGKVLV